MKFEGRNKIIVSSKAPVISEIGRGGMTSCPEELLMEGAVLGQDPFYSGFYIKFGVRGAVTIQKYGRRDDNNIDTYDQEPFGREINTSQTREPALRELFDGMFRNGIEPPKYFEGEKIPEKMTSELEGIFE